MRSNPEQFDHLKLLYSLSSQKSQTKQTTITIDSVTSGQMITSLLQKFRDKKEVFLTANDEKKMLVEITTNIRMDTFDEFEVGSPDTELQIYNALKDLLVTSRTTIKEQSDKMWKSVFWNEDNNRPDRTTKTLNEIINKLDEETKKKLADMFQKVEGQSEIIEKSPGLDKEHSINEKWELAKNNSDERNRSLENKERIQHNDSNSWVDVDRISSEISEKIANDSDSSRRVEVMNDDVVKLLQESRNHVQWDGAKFVPKPMQLGGINLGQFRDSQSFQDRNVRVRYTTAELSAPIKFVEHAELMVVDEWHKLKDELKDTRELLNTTVMKLTETSTELSNVKSDFTNTKIDLANKLEGTRQELVKTKIELEKTMSDFSKTVDDLSGKLNATENKLAEMTIIAGNSSSSELKDSAKLQGLGDRQETAEENLKKNRKETLNHLETKTTHLNTSRAEFCKMPTSCADLKRMGHEVNGFFLVKGSEKMMEVVDCNFYSNQNADLQKWIGYADVKSAPVHFYVQRNSDFKKTATPIPFNLELVNEGNAMDISSGIFTAPRPGIYFFSFTAMLLFPRSSPGFYLEVELHVNQFSFTSDIVQGANTVANEFRLLAFHSSRKLEKGDKVWVTIDFPFTEEAYLVNSVLHFTHFTGIMLEEEIIASL
ncbi:uncharacterized protein LOC124205829 [Daphnia pulex]|uniref:uncharacterized protein LOC124205829 n=1 Tax=Daphnia pulex TaxID=6669 RepID=UPI001EE0132B|nr:uncharacterized protein LOC124205829 [Daphnia pulex]